MGQERTGPSRKSFESENDFFTPGYHRTPGYFSISALKALVTSWLRTIGYPPVQIVLWSGQEITSDEKCISARLQIRDPGALFKLAFDPELYFGEFYSAQRIEVQGSLLEFLEVVYKTWPYRQGITLKKLLAPFYDARRNSLSGSRRNIHHHYDIGNDFYRLWLAAGWLASLRWMTCLNCWLRKCPHSPNW
jgi:hypothetical protein